MKIIALTFGSESCASTYFRIHQYREGLASRGISLECTPADRFHDWPSLAGYDVVILQKRLFGGRALKPIRRHARRLIYDIDDAIWLPHGKRHHWITRLRTAWRLQQTVRSADLCLAANERICSKLTACGGTARVLPMALDENEWTFPERPPESRLRIGWAGSPANLRYLAAIGPEIQQVLKTHDGTELIIFSGAKPEFGRDLPYTHIPFESGKEAEVVRSFEVGLLPLPGDPFSAHKSPIKALQYMASGAAIAATVIGATQELLEADVTALSVPTPDDWQGTVSRLVRDAALRRRLRTAARQRFERTFSLSRNTELLIDHLQSMVRVPPHDDGRR